jgi:hypothetical protein
MVIEVPGRPLDAFCGEIRAEIGPDFTPEI